MKVSILCSDPDHPVFPLLTGWAAATTRFGNQVEIVHDVAELSGGDFLFLVSCHQIVGEDHRRRYRHALVLHASDLPNGRGWSPHVWAILEGKNTLTVSLANAEGEVDRGAIWQQRTIELDGTELCDEINSRLFYAELALMSWALSHCDTTEPKDQQGTPTYCRRRIPEDSRFDPHKPLADQFDLLRVADPERYPATFRLRGAGYSIRLERLDGGALVIGDVFAD